MRRKRTDSRDQVGKNEVPHSIAIVTDAWFPQVNGVVRTLETTCKVLRGWGHEVTVISADRYRSIPAPTYPEIRLALTWPGTVGRALRRIAPDAVHIATEGPLGVAARNHCVRRKVPFTTAYHTQFPDYIARRTGLSPKLFWPFIRWFHRPAERILVATETIRAELREHGLAQVAHWSRGVDLACFTPDAPPPPEYEGLKSPIMLFVGRVAVEKNIEAFLACDYPGSKVVVGDGPARESLEKQFPDALFLGKRTGRELAGCYAGADVFVFPSKTDTFGLVMIEALACGTPVAAFPVPGPIDVLDHTSGAMCDQIERAIDAALLCDSKQCAKYGAGYSWEAATRQFLSALVALDDDRTVSLRPKSAI
ncbi:glycosyltransferase family 1 protein [Erythrobacter sp. THAF29]|uniref:glycosyltransferase family 4 protein n=1 Tax=Erythrobacter sp. THAF29 TaxID=2587851 RepID=UPI0012A969D6|nr:glycosyltransferase family 1 protein [Erythrobacter sp. THAF29]QFT76336.1 GDP-mannose-dependent alpha-mannosyltransferase [Erythrobacter sp. THAF29]